MSAPIKHGSTDQSTVLRFLNSTTGAPETVDHATAGLALWYRRGGGAKVAITPQALASLDAAHTDGGVEAIGDGYSRIDVPDAAFASGSDVVAVGGSATGIVAIAAEHPLVANVEADTYGIVSHVDHGNAALKSLIDDILEDTGTTLPASLTTILSAITAINNLSALANIFGPSVLEIPDSGSTAFPFTITVKDQEGKLVALDGAPTLAVTNAAGTDRSSYASAVSNPATGRYTFTITIPDDATAEGAKIEMSGTVSGEARFATWNGAIVDYDSVSTIDQMYAILSHATYGNAAIKTALDTKATQAKLLKYVQLLARSDVAIATDNATELTEINTDGGSGVGDWSNQTESLEAILDRGNLDWSASGGAANPSLLQATTIATLTSQTVFTLTAGSADDDTYNNRAAIIVDQSTSTQKAVVSISDYVGATKQVTLRAAPGFTIEAGDSIYILLTTDASLVWSHISRTLTQSAADVAATLAGHAVSMRRGDSFTKSLTGLGSLAGRSKLWLTVKRGSKDKADSKSTIQITEDDGLVVLNAEAITGASQANATLVVDDEDEGDVTITIAAAATAELDAFESGFYDIQMKVGDDVSTITESTWEVTADVTRSIT